MHLCIVKNIETRFTKIIRQQEEKFHLFAPAEES